MICYFISRHYIYEQKLSSLLWKIDYKDLIITETTMHDNVAMSNSSNSDKIHDNKIKVQYRQRYIFQFFCLIEIYFN